jgi:hypothetical protein
VVAAWCGVECGLFVGVHSNDFSSPEAVSGVRADYNSGEAPLPLALSACVFTRCSPGNAVSTGPCRLHALDCEPKIAMTPG